MKVLNLQCAHQHGFEGWFASEDEFLDQRQRGLLVCPLCNDATISKMLSAPRLNLSTSRGDALPPPDSVATHSPALTLQAAWVAVARHIMATTDDVGHQFAEEARKMHYGEVQERPIRGQATSTETEALLDEGIEVLPLLLPEALKEPLQ